MQLTAILHDLEDQLIESADSLEDHRNTDLETDLIYRKVLELYLLCRGAGEVVSIRDYMAEIETGPQASIKAAS